MTRQRDQRHGGLLELSDLGVPFGLCFGRALPTLFADQLFDVLGAREEFAGGAKDGVAASPKVQGHLLAAGFDVGDGAAAVADMSRQIRLAVADRFAERGDLSAECTPGSVDGVRTGHVPPPISHETFVS